MVADTMRRRLDELGPDERAEVEQASSLLRRARAGRRLPTDREHGLNHRRGPDDRRNRPHRRAESAARAKDSDDKRRRVLAAIHAMETAGHPITAAAVATAAGVSTWLRLRRRHPRTPRRRPAPPGPAAPAARPPPPRPATRRRSPPPACAPTSPSPETRSAGYEPNSTNSAHRLRLQLGAEIEQPDRAELIARVAELEAATRQLLAERDARTTEADHAQRRIHELEDDLTAARESLRRVIKDHNRP